MALSSDEQAQLVRDVENLRSHTRNASNVIKTSVDGQVRNALVQRKNLEAKIAEAGSDYADAYGDGSEGTLAAEVTAEIAAINTAIDAVVAITGKTRSDFEAEI